MKRPRGEPTFPPAEARSLWATLTRAVPATPELLRRWPTHAATIKLDGRRAALVRRHGTLWRVTAAGAEQLPDAAAGPDFVADAEELAGTFHVFDVLAVGTRDVRALTLPRRLEALAAGLPPAACLKPYEVLRAPADLTRLLAASRAAVADGLVLVSLAAPYEQPPLKFKERVTCDLALESCGERYRLLACVRQQLRPLPAPLPPWLLLRRAEAARLRLPAPVRRGDRVVVECELVQGAWRALRRRDDRTHPNDLRTVESNVALATAGMHTARWLLGAVRFVDGPAALACWLADLRRALTLAALGRAPGAPLADLGDPRGYEDLYADGPWRAATAHDARADELWLALFCTDAAQLRQLLAAGWRRLVVAGLQRTAPARGRLAVPGLWDLAPAACEELLRATGAELHVLLCAPPSALLRAVPALPALRPVAYELRRAADVPHRT